MAWQLTAKALASQRDKAMAKAEEHADHLAYEPLARAHRWLDEEEPARRWFRAAAEDVDASVEQPGRGNYPSRGQTGTLLWLAGDEPGGRHWLEWAIASSPVDSDGQLADIAAWRYLLSDFEGCLESAGAMREPEPYQKTRGVAALARARLDGDPAAIEAVVAGLTDALRADRLPPADKSGSSSGNLYDWLEEAFRVEAELNGAAMPDHATMLERAGLLEGGSSAATSPGTAFPDLPATGRWSIPREAPDGATVDLVLTREPSATDALLDPRAGTELRVHFAEQFDEVRLLIEWGDDEEGWVEERLGPFADHDQAAEAASDWLRAYGPDPPGGTWAADALAALLDAARAA